MLSRAQITFHHNADSLDPDQARNVLFDMTLTHVVNRWD